MQKRLSEYTSDGTLKKKASSSIVEYDSDEETVATVFQRTSWTSVESSSSSPSLSSQSPTPSNVRLSQWKVHVGDESSTSIKGKGNSTKKQKSNKKSSKKTKFNWWNLTNDEDEDEAKGPKRKVSKARHSWPVTSAEHQDAIKSINKSLEKKKTKKKTKTDKKKRSKKTKRKQRKDKNEIQTSSTMTERDTQSLSPQDELVSCAPTVCETTCSLNILFGVVLSEENENRDHEEGTTSNHYEYDECFEEEIFQEGDEHFVDSYEYFGQPTRTATAPSMPRRKSL